MTRAGRAFCAGADMGGWTREIQQRGAGETTARQQRQSANREAESRTGFIMRSRPFIAAINGPAIGVGLTMTLAAEGRIASENARLSMRFVRVGVIPGLASTHLLSHIVGVNHAHELMLSGRRIGAAEAGRIGLVSRLVPHNHPMDQAIAAAAEIAFNPAGRLAAIKRLTWQTLSEGDIGQVIKREKPDLGPRRPGFRGRRRKRSPRFAEEREPDFYWV